eukprot:995976_1
MNAAGSSRECPVGITNIVSYVLNKHVLPPKTLDGLLHNMGTSRNENANMVTQQLIGKHRYLGAHKFHAQVNRGICQVNEPYYNYLQRMALLGQTISDAQKQSIKKLHKNMMDRRARFENNGDPYKSKQNEKYMNTTMMNNDVTEQGDVQAMDIDTNEEEERLQAMDIDVQAIDDSNDDYCCHKGRNYNKCSCKN